MRLHGVLPLFLLSSCYTYRPLAAPAPAAGTAIDVELNDNGMQNLAVEVGPGVRHVQGRVLRADSSALDLSVTGVENLRGEPTAWNGERLLLPERYVQRIQERRLSAGGTGILGGAVAASLVAAYRLIAGPTTAVGPQGKPGGGSH